MVQAITTKQHENTMKRIVQNEFPEIINLNIGGHYYVTKRSTLVKDSESMLAAMFSGRHNIEKDRDGRYFIDRDGANFGYILNFLRDDLDIPPPSLSLQVYKEAQFYQVRGLIEKLERNAHVFALKLDEAKKSRLGNSFSKWKDEIVATAQRKSMKELSSSSRVNVLSLAEHGTLLEYHGECVAGEDTIHNIVISNTSENKSTRHSLENVKNRLRNPDILVAVPSENMELCVKLLGEELTNEGYSCKTWKEEIRCKNIRTYFYGIGEDECEFHLNEYYVEFEWSLPKMGVSEN